jgi:hypothetical protein
VTKRLTAERITTLGELIAYRNVHGGSWWRSVPRTGAHRAVPIAWLRRLEEALGVRLTRMSMRVRSCRQCVSATSS